MMKQTRLGLLAIIGSAALFLSPSPASAQITLGSMKSFAALGGTTVTNTGHTAIIGDVGVSPGTAVTGFHTVVVTGGAIHAGDAVAGQAQTDLTAAYNAIAETPCNVDLTGQDLSGRTLTPGVYCFSSSAFLSGILTLDFQGNHRALFLFKIGSSLITSSGSAVVMKNYGAFIATGLVCPPPFAPNLFWQVGSSATLGTTSSFSGNILALTNITLNTGAQLYGRALARNGAVTLDTNHLEICSPSGGAGACPVITVNPATLPTGQIGTPYSAAVSATEVYNDPSFFVSSGSLPAGLSMTWAGVISGTPTAAGTSNFTITANHPAWCFGSRGYSISIAAAAVHGIPTLDWIGLALLIALIAGAGIFLAGRSSL